MQQNTGHTTGPRESAARSSSMPPSHPAAGCREREERARIFAAEVRPPVAAGGGRAAVARPGVPGADGEGGEGLPADSRTVAGSAGNTASCSPPSVVTATASPQSRPSTTGAVSEAVNSGLDEVAPPDAPPAPQRISVEAMAAVLSEMEAELAALSAEAAAANAAAEKAGAAVEAHRVAAAAAEEAARARNAAVDAACESAEERVSIWRHGS
jgi:hypothetical protein